ncbi:MAG: hypothetical protein U0X75_16485 [Acidobacteriota bacterium]
MNQQPANLRAGAFKLNPVRVGLWDRYGGSMPSGWTRWLLEQFEFPFTVVYPQQLDAGDLASKFDVLIFVSGAIPARSGREGAGDEMGFGRAPRAEEIPEEFRAWLGNITPSKTIPELKKFLDAGGTILTVGSSTNLAYHADLPLGSALVERAGDGNERPLSRDKFYIPGSVLQVRVNNRSPLAYGLPDRLDVFYDNSPVFKLKPEATLRNVRPVAWFESDNPLRSGWAWGQKYLQDGVAVVEAQVGKGKLFMFGPEITFRAQPHGVQIPVQRGFITAAQKTRSSERVCSNKKARVTCQEFTRAFCFYFRLEFGQDALAGAIIPAQPLI